MPESPQTGQKLPVHVRNRAIVLDAVHVTVEPVVKELQQTPFAVTAAPPSDVTLPIHMADVCVTDEME